MENKSNDVYVALSKAQGCDDKFGTRISMPGPPQMFDENYVLSGLETSITMSCLLESAGLALQQDAMDPWLLAHCACLLWKRPTGIVKEDWEMINILKDMIGN